MQIVVAMPVYEDREPALKLSVKIASVLRMKCGAAGESVVYRRGLKEAASY